VKWIVDWDLKHEGITSIGRMEKALARFFVMLNKGTVGMAKPLRWK